MMRHFSLLLVLCLMLSGCTASQPEAEAPAAAAVSDTTIALEATQPAETTVPETEAPDPVQLLLDSLSTEEKVGQLFLARCPTEIALSEIEHFQMAGYLLFGQDFDGQTPDSLRETLVQYQTASAIPMLIAVDEEGGTVCRVSGNPAFRSSRFPSPRRAYAAGGMENVLACEQEKAALLRDLGINVIMGPVCDIATTPGAFMYDRSLGQSPKETGRFVANTVAILNNHKMGSVLKHFPGYGENSDTHTGIALDDRSLTALEEVDLVPFAAGIGAGCDAIMVSHTIVAALDASYPATLSPSVHHYLRSAMKFEGVIVTDDLYMQAISDAYGAEEAAVLAVLAGNDLLCSTEYALQYSAVLEAVESGRIPMDTVNQAVYRVLHWKDALGLLF